MSFGDLLCGYGSVLGSDLFSSGPVICLEEYCRARDLLCARIWCKASCLLIGYRPKDQPKCPKGQNVWRKNVQTHTGGQMSVETKCPWEQNVWRSKTSGDKTSFWHMLKAHIKKFQIKKLNKIASVFLYIITNLKNLNRTR